MVDGITGGQYARGPTLTPPMPYNPALEDEEADFGRSLTREQMRKVMLNVFEELEQVREAGQQEYAHDEGNAFANFQRVADDLGLDQKEVLWVFAMKHRDGIASYIKGHESQREDVRGRIKDLIMYLILLRGMIDAEEGMSP